MEDPHGFQVGGKHDPACEVSLTPAPVFGVPVHKGQVFEIRYGIESKASVGRSHPFAEDGLG